jgi:hypothetical protein
MDEFLLDNGIKIIKRSTINNIKKVVPNNKLTIIFNEVKDEVINLDLLYNFKSMVETNKENFTNKKIGTIDFETYGEKNGRQIVRAGGWYAEGDCNIYNLGDIECDKDYKIIKKLFTDILISKYYDYTFYIHNLAKFDAILILDALSRSDEFNMKSFNLN